eukprot:11178339-Lingulodinium_polyedra.AAC.1
MVLGSGAAEAILKMADGVVGGGGGVGRRGGGKVATSGGKGGRPEEGEDARIAVARRGRSGLRHPPVAKSIDGVRK